MAGLAAAWELSRPEHRDRIESVTLYERRPWLGGKGASRRGVHGRIEEHGLHVWLGYYDNAFRLIREVYGELGLDWRDAFRPADLIGAATRDGSSPPWMARFGRNDLTPGDPGRPARPLSIAELVGRAINLLFDVSRSLSRRSRAPQPSGVFLSTSADPTEPHPRTGLIGSLGDFGEAVRIAEVAALVAAVQALSMAERGGPAGGALRDGVLEHLGTIRRDLESRLDDHEDGRRLRSLVDLVVIVLRGTIVDRLVGPPDRLASIDHLDFRAWLTRHGARSETTSSPLVNAMYDFVFAYEDGDGERPAFAAGLGLFLASKLFFEYRGAIFWKMRAGMGDVVMQPLHDALRRRGVAIELGARVDDLRLAEDASALDSVAIVAPDGPSVTLRRGVDFDDVILAVSLGALPMIAGELIAKLPGWHAMVSNVRTVATRSFQAWLTASEADLGWEHAGATVSGWRRPFDTYASMSHLLAVEDWPPDGPASLAYFCSMAPDSGSHDAAEHATRAAARELLRDRIGELWPQAVDASGFRWDLLYGGFDAQYFATNDDPSDRYVQSLPGTGGFRRRADQSGCAHLALAGDWINSGLNAGCIEAAVISGLEAANVVLGRPLTEGVSGSLYGLGLDTDDAKHERLAS